MDPEDAQFLGPLGKCELLEHLIARCFDPTAPYTDADRQLRLEEQAMIHLGQVGQGFRESPRPRVVTMSSVNHDCLKP